MHHTSSPNHKCHQELLYLLHVGACRSSGVCFALLGQWQHSLAITIIPDENEGLTLSPSFCPLLIPHLSRSCCRFCQNTVCQDINSSDTLKYCSSLCTPSAHVQDTDAHTHCHSRLSNSPYSIFKSQTLADAATASSTTIHPVLHVQTLYAVQPD